MNDFRTKLYLIIGSILAVSWLGYEIHYRNTIINFLGTKDCVEVKTQLD